MRRLLSIFVVALVLFGTVAAPAAAEVDHVPVAGVAWMEEWYEQAWSQHGVTYHEYNFGRSRVEGYANSPGREYVSGTMEITLYNMHNGVTQTGVAHFSGVLRPDAYPDGGWRFAGTGTWAFSWEWPWTWWELATRQVYIGFGELQGMQMTLTDISTEEVPGVHFFEGEVQITPST